jgi:NAD(P)-dependent dehydrogenase (short-subunit alcohol dehydrogenase family)
VDINGSIAFITGADGGLGAAFGRALVDRGAATVYAGARDPASIEDDRLAPVRLDITDRSSIESAAIVAADVDLLINNAGLFIGIGALGSEDGLRRAIEINCLGPIAVSRAFAPVLASNGGGAILNVLSVLSWCVLPIAGAYSAAEAAMWGATNAMRLELHEQGTQVTALHAATLDRQISASNESTRATPDAIAAQGLDAVEAGDLEVLVDDVSRRVRGALSGPLQNLYPTLA